MDFAFSVEGVPIRLTSERWFHIVELLKPMTIWQAITMKSWKLSRDRKWSCVAIAALLLPRAVSVTNGNLMVVYRQLSKNDGFIITAYFTNKIDRKKVIWKKQ
jgi:hypothetical protein